MRAIWNHFSGANFFRLPKSLHARPASADANHDFLVLHEARALDDNHAVDELYRTREKLEQAAGGDAQEAGPVSAIGRQSNSPDLMDLRG
jgi:hypothetical protein